MGWFNNVTKKIANTKLVGAVANWFGAENNPGSYYNNARGYNLNQNGNPTSGGSWIASRALNQPSYSNPSLFNNYPANSTTTGGAVANIIPAYGKTVEDFYNPKQATAQATKMAQKEYNTDWGYAQKGFGLETTNANQDLTIGTQIENDALQRFLAQTGLDKTRSAEDLATSLASLEAQKGEARATTSYDRVRQLRGLVGDLAAKGLQYGGMAEQAGQEAAQGRKMAKDTMERQFKEAVGGANTTATRQSQDILTREADRKKQNEQMLANLIRTKQRALADINLRRQTTQHNLDVERRNRIENAKTAAYNKAFQLWEIGLNQHKSNYGA